MNPVVHFEMPYENRDRMAEFYRNTFGWRTEMLGPEMGSYVLATTTETGQEGPTTPGTINGGFFAKMPEMRAEHPNIVIAVDDIERAMSRVSAAGGKVLGSPMDIPNVGRYVSFIDTEGNRSSMLQPIPRNRHAE